MKMRWYDRDQTVSLAMSIIKNSSENAQLDVALLINSSLKELGVTKKYTIFQRFEGFIKRWYDYNDELFESFEALKAAPKKIQKIIALDIINFLHELEIQEAKKAKKSMKIDEISNVESNDTDSIEDGAVEIINDGYEITETEITLINEENVEYNAEEEAEKII